MVDVEDKLEIEWDFCWFKCCFEIFVEKEIENMNEKFKEDFSVEEKEKDMIEEEYVLFSREIVSFCVVWNKKNYEVIFFVDEIVDSFK